MICTVKTTAAACFQSKKEDFDKPSFYILLYFRKILQIDGHFDKNFLDYLLGLRCSGALLSEICSFMLRFAFELPKKWGYFQTPLLLFVIIVQNITQGQAFRQEFSRLFARASGTNFVPLPELSCARGQRTRDISRRRASRRNGCS